MVPGPEIYAAPYIHEEVSGGHKQSRPVHLGGLHGIRNGESIIIYRQACDRLFHSVIPDLWKRSGRNSSQGAFSTG